MSDDEDRPLMDINYADIEARILAHMASEKKIPTGTIIHEFSENGHHFQVELLTEPNITGRGNKRPYRLWHNGTPALGGQWHYTIDGALRRAQYVMQGHYAEKIACLERQVVECERRIAAVVDARKGSGGAMSAGESVRESPSRMATARIDVRYSERVSHSGAIEIHAPTLEQAEAKRDVLIEQRDAICDFLQAWDALPVENYHARVVEKWLNGDDMKSAVADLRKISRFESVGGRLTLRQTVRTALEHLEHMAAHVARWNAWLTGGRSLAESPGYYVMESLGEDIDTLRRAGLPPNPNRD